MIKWSERYSIHTAALPAGRLTVAWKDGGYVISALGKTLKEPARDVETAKARAVALARKVLTQSLAALPE